MSATNKTQHYNLPQFVAGDIPAWMTDVNNAMATIDGAIYDVASDEATVGEAVAQLGTRVTSAENAVAGLGTTVQGVQSDVAENTADIDTLEGNVNGLGTRMTAVEGTVGTLGTTVQGVQGDVADNTADIGELDTRVTALEQGGSVGEWTLVGTVNAPASSGGAETVESVTVPTDATEIFITVVNSNGENVASTLGLTSGSGLQVGFIRVVGTGITDYVQGKYNKASGELRCNWVSGTAAGNASVKLYAR